MTTYYPIGQRLCGSEIRGEAVGEDDHICRLRARNLDPSRKPFVYQHLPLLERLDQGKIQTELMLDGKAQVLPL